MPKCKPLLRSKDQDGDPASDVGMLTGVMQATNLEEVDHASSEASLEGQALQEWVVSAENSIDAPLKLPMMPGRLSSNIMRKARDTLFSMVQANTITVITPNSDMQVKIQVSLYQLLDIL